MERVKLTLYGFKYRYKSLVKLEARLNKEFSNINDEVGRFLMPEYLLFPTNRLIMEYYGKLLLRQTTVIETYLGSGEWVIATRDKGTKSRSELDLTSFVSERDGRIFFSEGTNSKVAFEVQYSSGDWMTATIIPWKD